MAMDQEELEKIVRETHELSRMNYKMLKSLRDQARWAIVFKIIYFGVIFGLFYVAYNAVKPTLDSLQNTYQNIESLNIFGN